MGKLKRLQITETIESHIDFEGKVNKLCARLYKMMEEYGDDIYIDEKSENHFDYRDDFYVICRDIEEPEAAYEKRLKAHDKLNIKQKEQRKKDKEKREAKDIKEYERLKKKYS